MRDRFANDGDDIWIVNENVEELEACMQTRTSVCLYDVLNRHVELSTRVVGDQLVGSIDDLAVRQRVVNTQNSGIDQRSLLLAETHQDKSEGSGSSLVRLEKGDFVLDWLAEIAGIVGVQL